MANQDYRGSVEYQLIKLQKNAIDLHAFLVGPPERWNRITDFNISHVLYELSDINYKLHRVRQILNEAQGDNQ